MEAKLVNSVLNIQRLVRGFLARKQFEKILEDLYLKETKQIIDKIDKKPDSKNQPDYEYIEFADDMSNEAILKALKGSKENIENQTQSEVKNKEETQNLSLESTISLKNSSGRDYSQKLASEVKSKKEKNWDATITHKPKANTGVITTTSSNNLNCSKENKKNDTNTKMINNNNTQKNKTDTLQKANNLADLKKLSTSSNQSKKEENDSNKSFKISEKNCSNTSKSMLNKTPINGKINENNISAISSNKLFGSSTYSPRSDKLKPIYYEFDVFLNAAIQIQKTFRGHLSRQFLCDYYALKHAIRAIEKHYLKFKSHKAKKIKVNYFKNILFLSIHNFLYGNKKEYITIMNNHQKKIIQNLQDLQNAEKKILTVCRSKQIEDFIRNYRSKMQVSFQNFINQNKKNYSQTKDQEIQTINNNSELFKQDVCCNLKERKLQYLQQKMNKNRDFEKSKEMNYCKKIVELQTNNDKLKQIHKNTLIKFIKGVTLLREKMETLCSSNKSNNLSEISLIAKDLLKGVTFDSICENNGEEEKSSFLSTNTNKTPLNQIDKISNSKFN